MSSLTSKCDNNGYNSDLCECLMVLINFTFAISRAL